jgi:basic membrane protein A
MDKVMAERDAIIAGKQIFNGPIKDTGNVERVAEGKSLDDAGFWKMDWYVPGVIAQK